MDFKDTPEEAAFRQEIRSFIGQNLPEDRSLYEVVGEEMANPTGPEEGRTAFMNQWRKALAGRGWIAPHWPKEHGGGGMSTIEQFIYNEEMARVRAPTFGGFGTNMIGPVLLMYGTDEQKAQHLPGITSGDVLWCQGYSEPGAGSDLASLQTRAVRDGDDFVINGQKIWTSGAHRANWMFMLARTDPDAPKHRGISMFLLDIKTPGIQIQPLVNMANDHHFNQDYFDNVRIPAKNLVGELNRGWYVGATLLDFERSNVSGAIALRHTVDDLIEYVSQNPDGRVCDNRAARLEMADRAIEADIARLFSYRIISLQKRGMVPNYEASVNKMYRSEVQQRIAQTGMRLIGLYGNTWKGDKWAPLKGRISHMYVGSVSATIAAGTSEIQRNVIATRGLGLPRG